MTKLTVFLGNPGKEYARTRHNLPWMLLESLPFYRELVWKKKFHGLWADWKTGGNRILLLKPETYMNNSGQSTSAALTFFKLTPANLLIVHDDIELPFGSAALKHGGGTAGHNGLRSIGEAVGTREFSRFRLGVSRPAKGTVSSYVLSRFTPEEEAELNDYMCKSAREMENIFRN